MPRYVALESLQQFAAVNLQFDGGAIGGPKVIPQAAEISLVWSLASGKIAHNVLTGRYNGAFAGSQAQANAIVAGLTTGSAWTNLAAFLATTAVFVGVNIRDLNAPNQ